MTRFILRAGLLSLVAAGCSDATGSAGRDEFRFNFSGASSGAFAAPSGEPVGLNSSFAVALDYGDEYVVMAYDSINGVRGNFLMVQVDKVVSPATLPVGDCFRTEAPCSEGTFHLNMNPNANGDAGDQFFNFRSGSVTLEQVSPTRLTGSFQLSGDGVTLSGGRFTIPVQSPSSWNLAR